MFIDKLLQLGGICFLHRPRGFGKTLFLSMLNEYFCGHENLFEGLEIVKNNPEWKEYKVLRFDFARVDAKSAETISGGICDFLDELAEKFNVIISLCTNTARKLRKLLQSLCPNDEKCVVLIDNYDAPIWEHLEDKHLPKIVAALRLFYNALWEMRSKLHFVFVTGLVRFDDAFPLDRVSEAGGLHDISKDNDFALICGITEEEITWLLQHCGNEVRIDNCAADEIPSVMMQKYGNYSLFGKNPIVCCTGSVVRSLSSRHFDFYLHKEFMPSFLPHYMMRHLELLGDYTDGVPATREDIDEAMNMSIGPIAYFIQTGYLSVEDIDGNLLVTYPNEDARNAHVVVFPRLCYSMKCRYSFDNDYLKIALAYGNANVFFYALRRIINNIPSETRRLVDSESAFHLIFSTIITLLGAYNVSERRVRMGQADCVILTAMHTWVVELKVDRSAESALRQIKGRNYWQQELFWRGNVILLGLKYSSKNRNVVDYSVETHSLRDYDSPLVFSRGFAGEPDEDSDNSELSDIMSDLQDTAANEELISAAESSDPSWDA